MKDGILAINSLVEPKAQNGWRTFALWKQHKQVVVLCFGDLYLLPVSQRFEQSWDGIGVTDKQHDVVAVLAAEKLNEIFHIALIEFCGELR